MDYLPPILLLLGVSVGLVMLFQRLHIPTSLAYLAVGVVLGPYTGGPTVNIPGLDLVGEIGVVFLLFTVGLSFSLPKIHAMRHQLLGLGTGQVALTTLAVMGLLWAGGVAPAVAFVVGAVFAQSSTSIMAALLAEQGEAEARHGRLGIGLSVFQDVTAVPFLVVIPVLGSQVAAEVLGLTLAAALGKALLAFALLYVVGRWLLGPLFHVVASRRSLEVFTLTVLLVTLLSAWTTGSLGLSLAFGGFLAGMMLGESEFRHQIESSIRPFRDVLLGIFFVGIGMRFDPGALLSVWMWVFGGALLILLSKALIVFLLVRRGADTVTALRTGLLLAVGGEFGLALIAIALDARVIEHGLGQILIGSVLLAMVLGAAVIRFNGALAARLLPKPKAVAAAPEPLPAADAQTVVLAGYGRVGHTIAVLLRVSGVRCVVFDADPRRVAQARQDGFEAFVGDVSDPELLVAIKAGNAALLALTLTDSAAALKATRLAAQKFPGLPVIARARDLEASTALLAAGATQAYPELIEASLRLGAAVLNHLAVPHENVDHLIQDVRDEGYRPVVE
ncbi:MAG: cation:proton antiporter [Xanthomonadales bacterium]|jgi:CPA2 family monovalent cation:H+ antiporter-2|nr:cation:proton antiporter [Xanthomonadales bacterium]